MAPVPGNFEPGASLHAFMPESAASRIGIRIGMKENARADRGARVMETEQVPAAQPASRGVSAIVASRLSSSALIVTSVSSPMLEMRKVLPLSLP